MSDQVHHPEHYGGDTIYETIKVIEAWGLGFCLGNAVKYISRAGKKSSTSEVQDLEKALWYLHRALTQARGRESASGASKSLPLPRADVEEVRNKSSALVDAAKRAIEIQIGSTTIPTKTSTENDGDV